MRGSVGFSISWIGFKALPPSEVLRRTGFRDLAIDDPAYESPFSLAVLPTGWTILFANNFSYGAGRRLNSLSSDAVLVACQIEEHVMYSGARCFVNGDEHWSACHDCQKGVYDLSVSGALPAAFEPIKQCLHGKQLKEPAMFLTTDYYFDIPVELACDLTGYRHDCRKFDWGEPRFTKLERAGSTQQRD